MSDARVRAVAAMVDADATYWKAPAPVSITGHMLALLDAIPNDVLAAYAIERGALDQCGWCYVTGHRLDDQPTLCRDEPTAHRFRQPLYRLATEDET